MTHSSPTLRRLGASGLAVSSTGLGCNNLGRKGTVTENLEGCRLLIDAALDAGITLFDTADLYGSAPGVSEEMLGKALEGRRDDVIVATKFGMKVGSLNGPDFGARGSRRYIRKALEGSLRRLNTDWIDLYQLHEPDPSTPIEETLEALSEVVREGKVRYLGHSNLSGWQLADASWTARDGGHVPFISAQNEYSLLNRKIEADLMPAAEAFGVGILPFFPLANGLLSGKYTRDHHPAGSRITDLKPQLLESAPWDQLEALAAFAAARDITMIELVFGWLLAQPQISSVIAGATSPAQVASNAAAATAWSPSIEELVAIDEIFPAGR